MKSNILILILCSFAIYLQGQRLNTPTLSPYSEVKQEIGLTEIQVQYARPSAKDRSVFGDLVPFNKIWRTGANASTKLIVHERIEIAGNALDSGMYAIYTIPHPKEWTIIIHSNTGHRSIAGDRYKQEEDVFRFPVFTERSVDYTETFTIEFTDIKTNRCNLRLRWEHTLINIPISVQVDSKIESQMQTFLKDPESIPHRTYFEAAQYYLHNGKDLNDALDWINAAFEKSEKNFRYGLLKAKIQLASNESDKALETITVAHSWAVEAKNANYIEQTSIFMESIKQ